MKRLGLILSLVLVAGIVCAEVDSKALKQLRDIRNGEDNRNQIVFLLVDRDGTIGGALTVGSINVLTNFGAAGTISADIGSFTTSVDAATAYFIQAHVQGDGGLSPDLTVSNGNYWFVSTQGWSVVDCNTEYDTGSSSFRFSSGADSLGWDISTVGGGATLQLSTTADRTNSADYVYQFGSNTFYKLLGCVSYEGPNTNKVAVAMGSNNKIAAGYCFTTSVVAFSEAFSTTPFIVPGWGGDPTVGTNVDPVVWTHTRSSAGFSVGCSAGDLSGVTNLVHWIAVGAD